MILIDKAKEHQDLILTLTEKTTVAEPDYLLVLVNDADKSEYSIELNQYHISSNNRFDFYRVATSVFDTLPGGYYTYSIFEDELDSAVVETGKLLIKELPESIQIITPNRSEEYLIYK